MSNRELCGRAPELLHKLWFSIAPWRRPTALVALFVLPQPGADGGGSIQGTEERGPSQKEKELYFLRNLMRDVKMSWFGVFLTCHYSDTFLDLSYWSGYLKQALEHARENSSPLRFGRYLAQLLLDFTKSSCMFLPSHSMMSLNLENSDFVKAGSASAAAGTRVRREGQSEKEEVISPFT